MKKFLFIFVAAFVLASCSSEGDFMKCGDFEVKVDVAESSITANINGDVVVLPQTKAASGARYEGVLNDVNVVLWNKGDDWTLYLNDDAPIDCK